MRYLAFFFLIHTSYTVVNLETSSNISPPGVEGIQRSGVGILTTIYGTWLGPLNGYPTSALKSHSVDLYQLVLDVL